MEETPAIDQIDADELDTLLQQYPHAVPEKLAKLEFQRLVAIPHVLNERKEENDAYLQKDQVATLVDWKLSHGTFRPTLKKLVQENDEQDVESTTREAFAILRDSPADVGQAKASIMVLTRLRGIGPATATLLLSCYCSETVPFFSDDLFRWCFWHDKAGAQWDRPIKYTVKEYLEMFAKVNEVRQRLQKHSGKDVAALDLEKAAYVLGKRSKGVFANMADRNPQTAGAQAFSAVTMGNKRKAADTTAESQLTPAGLQAESAKKKASKAAKVTGADKPAATKAVRRSTRRKDK